MFIGPNKIKGTEEKEGLVTVTYEGGESEILSKLMYDNVVSEEACDLTQLRDKRIHPVVTQVLTILRDWGIKLNELQYFSNVLNTSLQENEKAALLALWKPIIPMIKSIDDIDLVAIDRVLKA